jgi:hypothetical protein
MTALARVFVCLKTSEEQIRTNSNGGTVRLECEYRSNSREFEFSVEAGARHTFTVPIQELSNRLPENDFGQWAKGIGTIVKTGGFGTVSLRVGGCGKRRVVTWTTTTTRRSLE